MSPTRLANIFWVVVAGVGGMRGKGAHGGREEKGGQKLSKGPCRFTEDTGEHSQRGPLCSSSNRHSAVLRLPKCNHTGEPGLAPR